MAGRILIADSIATNRIVLKVKLSVLLYDIATAGSAKDVLGSIKTDRPDLILSDMALQDMNGAELCRQLRSNPETADIPIILMTERESPAERIAALGAGADGFLEKPIDHAILQARIRSVLRERTAAHGLTLRSETSRALGFAEAQATFGYPGHVAFISGAVSAAEGWKAQVSNHFEGQITVLPPAGALNATFKTSVPDVFVICARLSGEDLGLDLLSELRSRPDTRSSGIIVVVPSNAEHLSARALDQGASDLISGDFTSEELVLRLTAQIKRKQTMDALQQQIQVGLEAAVTDTLTGLPNRRYALSHLDSIRDRAKRDAKDFAVLVLDLDRFKAVNDTYGHATGDLVLKEFAALLRAHLRSEDLVARIGGEEFLVVMPNIKLSEAKGAARRICRVIHEAPFHLNSGKVISVSVSIGLTMGPSVAGQMPDSEALIDQADQALYAAKGAGRNRVSVGHSMIPKTRT